MHGSLYRLAVVDGAPDNLRVDQRFATKVRSPCYICFHPVISDLAVHPAPDACFDP
jgi:hypothetical protein